ncbi:MAG: hypothetical protein QOJ69_431 [Actinomycetota bacterium]|nr:hypothetical protein [Actinomycetota bacterium]
MDGDRRPDSDAVVPPHYAARRLALSACAGLAAALVAAWFVAWQATVLIGWEVAAGSFLVHIWRELLPQDAAATEIHASTEDDSRIVADLTLLVAAVASLVAVVLILVKAAEFHGSRKAMLTGVGIVAVAVSWAVVHTVFTLKYSHLYYGKEVKGIEFPGGERPAYREFAYLAFTIGMCYQVADTDLRSGQIRSTVLRHALLSYVLGTAVIALTINAVAGLV